MKKRIISLLLALVMLFGVLPVTALAESDDVVATSASKQGLGDKIKDVLGDFVDHFKPEDPSVCKGNHNADSYKETTYNVTIDKKYFNQTTNTTISNVTPLGNALSFTLTKNGTSDAYTFTWDSVSQRYTCNNNLPAGTYTITETGSTSIGEDWKFEGFAPKTVTIPATSEVEVKNLYTQVIRTADITVEKKFVDEDGNDLTPAELGNFAIMLGDNSLTREGTTGYIYKKSNVTAGNYTVTEEKVPDITFHTFDEMTLAKVNDDGTTTPVAKTGDNYQIKVVGGENASYVLTNTYTKNAPDALDFSLNSYIVKALTGGNLPNAQTFSVEVNVKDNNDKKTGTTASKTSFTNEPFVFDDNAKFSISSETIFEVKEVQGNAVDGLTYNNKTFEMKVTVRVDDATNAYVVDKVFWQEKDTNQWAKITDNNKPVITNTYIAPITTASVTFEKNFDGLTEAQKNALNIKIKLKKGSEEVILEKGSDGNYTRTDLPAGEYEVSEINATLNGYKYTPILKAAQNNLITKINVTAGQTYTFSLTNKYEEVTKTPAKVNFSDLIQKKLYITGDYKFTGETFRAKMRYKAESGFGTDAWYEFKAEFGKNTKSGAVKDFVIDSGVGDDGYDYIVSFPKAGEYVFYLFEENDGKSGVTYDKSIYKLTVNIKEEANKLVLDEIEYSKWNNGELSGEADKNGYVTVREPITFYNTVNTGKKGDHIKIDSPNKLNTDDHFAYIIGYPDGTVQPGGEITRAEVATIFFRLLKDDVRDRYFTKTNDFSDVSRGAWFNNPVSTMATLGIVKGYPDGTFRPNEPITRAEFAAIAARFDESSRYGETRFTDVTGHWAIREIAKAYNNGWIKGYPDNTFRPNRNITRAEAMTLINRVLNRAPETEKDLLNNMNKWSDNMDVDAWYYLAVQEATNSHDYRRKTSSYEHWLRMLEDPNWASYER